MARCPALCGGLELHERPDARIRALGLSGEIIIPSFTFFATAHAARWETVCSPFCGLRSRDWNIDLEDSNAESHRALARSLRCIFMEIPATYCHSRRLQPGTG